MNELLDGETTDNGSTVDGDPIESNWTGQDAGSPDRDAGNPDADEKVTVEEFPVEINNLVATVEQLLGQRRVRRIILKEKSGEVLATISPKFGVIVGLSGAALLPLAGALAAIGELVAEQVKGRRRGIILQQDLMEAALVGSAVASAFLPVAVGLGVLGAAIANLTIAIERTEN